MTLLLHQLVANAAQDLLMPQTQLLAHQSNANHLLLNQLAKLCQPACGTQTTLHLQLQLKYSLSWTQTWINKLISMSSLPWLLTVIHLQWQKLRKLLIRPRTNKDSLRATPTNQVASTNLNSLLLTRDIAKKTRLMEEPKVANAPQDLLMLQVPYLLQLQSGANHT